MTEGSRHQIIIQSDHPSFISDQQTGFIGPLLTPVDLTGIDCACSPPVVVCGTAARLFLLLLRDSGLFWLMWMITFALPGVPCLQNVTTATAHTKDKEGDLSKASKDGEHGKGRTASDPQANVFVLRKMVEEVFTVLYSKNRDARVPPARRSAPPAWL